jgi:hypothetical protein
LAITIRPTSRFLQGKWLSDDLLRILLRHIASPSHYYVADSLDVDIATPEHDKLCSLLRRMQHNFKGIVMPFHVQQDQQTMPSNLRDRNHWVMGILDFGESTFTVFDMNMKAAANWCVAFETALSQERRVAVSIRVAVGMVCSCDTVREKS